MPTYFLSVHLIDLVQYCVSFYKIIAQGGKKTYSIVQFWDKIFKCKSISECFWNVRNVFRKYLWDKLLERQMLVYSQVQNVIQPCYNWCASEYGSKKVSVIPLVAMGNLSSSSIREQVSRRLWCLNVISVIQYWLKSRFWLTLTLDTLEKLILPHSIQVLPCSVQVLLNLAHHEFLLQHLCSLKCK